MACAIHDLEDFLSAGTVCVRAAIEEIDTALAFYDPGKYAFGEGGADDAFSREAKKFRDKHGKYFDDDLYADALNLVRIDIDQVDDPDTPETVQKLRSTLSGYVDRFFQGVAVSTRVPWTNGPLVFLDESPWHLMRVLKVITRRFVVRTSRAGMLQRAQRKAVLNLADETEAWLRDKPVRTELPAPIFESWELLALLTRKRSFGWRITAPWPTTSAACPTARQ